MNRIHLSVLAGLLALSTAAAAPFTTGGTKISTNAIFATVPGGTTATFISTWGFNSGSMTMNFINATAVYQITNALPAGVGSNVLCNITTNVLAAGSGVAIYDVSADAFQRMWVHSQTAGSIVVTNIYETGQDADEVTLALADGDMVYALGTAIPAAKILNNTPTTFGGNQGGVFRPKAGRAGIVEVVCDTTTLLTNQFLVVSGE